MLWVTVYFASIVATKEWRPCICCPWIWPKCWLISCWVLEGCWQITFTPLLNAIYCAIKRLLVSSYDIIFTLSLERLTLMWNSSKLHRRFKIAIHRWNCVAWCELICESWRFRCKSSMSYRLWHRLIKRLDRIHSRSMLILYLIFTLFLIYFCHGWLWQVLKTYKRLIGRMVIKVLPYVHLLISWLWSIFIIIIYIIPFAQYICTASLILIDFDGAHLKFAVQVDVYNLIIP